MKMALTRDFRETVQARVKWDPAFRKGLLSEAIEGLLSGEVALGKELLRDYVNATVGFPELAAHTKIHAKTLHQMFGPNGNPTASHLLGVVAYLQHREGVRFEIRSARAVSRSRRRPFARGASRAASTAVSYRSVGASVAKLDSHATRLSGVFGPSTGGRLRAARPGGKASPRRQSAR